MSETVIHRPASGRGTLLLIVGLLVLPFAIGGALYVGGWHPERSIQHGQLLNPPQLLPDDVLRSTQIVRGKWIFLLKVRGICEAQCSARLDEMRRIQVSLNKEMGRLSRVVLTDQADDPTLTALHRTQPDLLVVVSPSDGLIGSADPLFLADPQGRLIMSYPPDAAAKGVRADLERLLKFAWTG